ncbi:MAG: CpsD/CapB family tyrosine-protein kinase, partial [Hydrogenophaga sp.]
GLPLLGLVPWVKPDRGADNVLPMLTHLRPRSAFAEAYRSMRTALQFSTASGAPQRFMITSCSQSEGKTTTALALAINFSQLGRRVLLIDADMRKPSIHKLLHMSNEKGLSNLLSGDDIDSGPYISNTKLPNLAVLTSGPIPPDPVELLAGPRLMQLLERAHELGFEQVVIDSPPLLGIADAVVLGSQVGHIVLAVKASSTKKAVIRDALGRLQYAGLTPMGVVLTHVRSENAVQYSYESYYGYGNEAQNKPAWPALRGFAVAAKLFSSPKKSIDSQPIQTHRSGDELGAMPKQGANHANSSGLQNAGFPSAQVAWIAAGVLLLGLLAILLLTMSGTSDPRQIAATHCFGNRKTWCSARAG